MQEKPSPANRTLAANAAVQSYIAQLRQGDLLVNLDWGTFIGLDAPYAQTSFQTNEVTARYRRNGYDWDIHGTLYSPVRENLPGYAFVLIHGGGVNELDFQATPDGRPGLAAVLAGQGFRVLTPSYPGLWPPGGKWTAPVKDRKPVYLLDRPVSGAELQDRMLKATYQVYMQGISLLVDDHLGGQKVFAHGHSTGGPMAATLNGYLKMARVVGIVGWGSGGPDGWIAQWVRETNPRRSRVATERDLTEIMYRTVEEYRGSSGYEDLPELTPWGRMEERFELTRDTTPMFNPPLQGPHHSGNLDRLQDFQKATGLPIKEYYGTLEPDPEFLRGIKVLLMVGENDRLHWKIGDSLNQKQEFFIAQRYSEKTRGTHLVVVPKYTHMGHWALHNEKLAYLWLWAVKSGFFA